MNEDLNISLPHEDPPDAAILQRISAQLAAVSAPVRPLPSNAALMTIGLAIFAAVSFAIASSVHLYAFASLSVAEMTVYYSAICLFAILFARALVERMIPGTKRLLPSAVLWGTALVTLGILMSGIFSDYITEHLVASGIPCLRLGAISALVSGLLGWRLLRRGYLVSPRETILLYCFFAGLVGVAVLALHCPIRNSLHCVIFHLGAMVLAGVAGSFLGRYFDNAD